jgi:hypothetical protein
VLVLSCPWRRAVRVVKLNDDDKFVIGVLTLIAATIAAILVLT